jgi:hypothetical protein
MNIEQLQAKAYQIICEIETNLVRNQELNAEIATIRNQIAALEAAAQAGPHPKATE